MTERELVILRHLARGLTNTDIAEKLILAEGTVRNNVSTILNKLGREDADFVNNIIQRYFGGDV